MNATSFVDVPFDSIEAWGAFQVMHGITHQSVYQALLKRGLTPTYIDPFAFPRIENETYLLDHWEMHRSNAALLGLTIGITDLATADFSDPAAYDSWLQMHALVHQAENQALGLN